jgi:hypothetical protein
VLLVPVPVMVVTARAVLVVVLVMVLVVVMITSGAVLVVLVVIVVLAAGSMLVVVMTATGAVLVVLMFVVVVVFAAGSVLVVVMPTVGTVFVVVVVVVVMRSFNDVAHDLDPELVELRRHRVEVDGREQSHVVLLRQHCTHTQRTPTSHFRPVGLCSPPTQWARNGGGEGARTLAEGGEERPHELVPLLLVLGQHQRSLRDVGHVRKPGIVPTVIYHSA